MDIETITLTAFDNLQIPIVITTYSMTCEAIFIIDHVKLLEAIKKSDIKDIDKLVDDLWSQYFNYLSSNPVFSR